MFLKKIELVGFKSFAHKTTLEFIPACNATRSTAGRPACNFNGVKKVEKPDDAKAMTGKCGITAIVGPNGSGKSNIADAVRWVMGEQSMKNLRGKKSEDVIFAGSGKKSRLGSAWATLYFDNSDKRIPLEFSEVTVTRRLFRSGDSEYLINGSKVRLIDLVDLLAKAGIGKESYCVINQGMSDAVLSVSPAERRIVLEDAAGVKQYQIKKERAIRKLESTRVNLERAGDLIKEITPHLRALKRQADKALKGKKLAQALREKQLLLFSYLWNYFKKERGSLFSEKNDLGAKMKNAQRNADKINDELSQYSKEAQNFERMEKLEKERIEVRNQLNSLEKELVINEGRLEVEKEKEINDELIENVPVDLRHVQSRLEKIRTDQEKLIDRLDKVENLSELQDIKEFARAIKQELYDLYQEASKGELAVKKNNTEEIKIHNEKMEALSEMCDKLRDKIKKQVMEVKRIDGAIEAETENTKQMRRKFFDLEHSLRIKQDELGKLKDQFNEAKVRLAKVEVREEDLTREIREELKMSPDELKYNGEEVDRSEAEEEISKLKFQMEQAGGIDPLVVDEYEETRKRHDFLTRESKDLEKAIKSLKEVVKEMDQKIGKVFNEAFEKINKEFTKYFRIIFGGGNAHLIKDRIKKRKLKLEEEEETPTAAEGDIEEPAPEDVSQEEEEIGIDIFACPPGKKITSLAMLSGGERALTSIALLFAIISHNPPPFAVLDEVEAALDEANSRRFGRILQELSANTQFVIITHNRETMRQASLLYGVTMGEDGISKLLSVHLDQVGKGGKIEAK